MSQIQDGTIIDVYSDNIDQEMKNISKLVDEYNFIAMVNLNIT